MTLEEKDCGCDREEDCQCESCSESELHAESTAFTFDKFMDSILVSESKRPKIMTEADSPQRRRAARNQERPLNRIRWSSK